MHIFSSPKYVIESKYTGTVPTSVNNEKNSDNDNDDYDVVGTIMGILLCESKDRENNY